MQAHHQQNIILRKRKIKYEPNTLDNELIIRQLQGHEVIKRKKLPQLKSLAETSPTVQKPSQSGTSVAPIRCGQCTFSHIDPNEVERHRNRFDLFDIRYGAYDMADSYSQHMIYY